METTKKRYFVLQENGNDSNHVFTGKRPRNAALKAANKGFERIRLRERGTKKHHIFNGSRVQVPVPENAPEWMKGKEFMHIPNVEKQGIEKI